jgi:short-subunit dehydrogenase involved in D-alanine esterification of teichoic acids
MIFKTSRPKRTDLSHLAQQLLIVAITMSITTSRYSSPHTLHDYAKHFLLKTLSNCSAWKVNQDCSINQLKTYNQGGFAAKLARPDMTHLVLPGMLERRSGAIISVASVAGHVALNPLYSGTKFGLRGFSLSLRRDLLRRGISVSQVSPGYVKTDMNKVSRLPIPKPELVGRTIVNLVIKPRREVIVPGYYRPLVGIANALPWLVDLTISRR